MRLNSGMVKILDFGVARAGAGPITRVGDIVGTLNYMSPEQLTGEPVDHRTDVYAVGALAYELFTHRMAFPGTIDTGVLHRILTVGPVPINDLVPSIDSDIVAFVERALARNADARYPDLETMRQDIAVVRARLPETVPDLDDPIAADTEAETRVDSGRSGSGSQQRPPSRRSSALGRAVGSAVPQSASGVATQPGRKSTCAARGRVRSPDRGAHRNIHVQRSVCGQPTGAGGFAGCRSTSGAAAACSCGRSSEGDRRRHRDGAGRTAAQHARDRPQGDARRRAPARARCAHPWPRTRCEGSGAQQSRR